MVRSEEEKSILVLITTEICIENCTAHGHQMSGQLCNLVSEILIFTTFRLFYFPKVLVRLLVLM